LVWQLFQGAQNPLKCRGLLKNTIPGLCNIGSKSRLLKNTIPEHLAGRNDPKDFLKNAILPCTASLSKFVAITQRSQLPGRLELILACAVNYCCEYTLMIIT